MPKPYSPEFRRRALDLPASGRSVRDVAASLGIAESCLHRWKSQDLLDRGLKSLTPEAIESAELAAARARIAELENEVKILRKAAAAAWGGGTQSVPVLISDHDSWEGSRAPLCVAVECVLGTAPVMMDARHFLNGGSGKLRRDGDGLVVEVHDEAVLTRASILFVYDIAPARRREFERFQRDLRRLGVDTVGTDWRAWRNATEKDRTVRCFRRHGIPHMDTITLRRPSPATAARCFTALGGDVWTRPTVGKGGGRVFHVTSPDQLHHAMAHYAADGQHWQMARDARNFDASGDRQSYRVIVLDGRSLVAVEHRQSDPDAPCNEARGALSSQLSSPEELPGNLGALAAAAVRALGLRFGGVDLTANGVVFEVNVHPVIARHLESVALPWVRAQAGTSP